MELITDRKYEWYDDRFYIVKTEKIVKAYEEGAILDPRIQKAIIEGKEEIWFPSSTTKLGAAPKPWLATWREKVGKEEADRRLLEGGNKGANVHEAIRIWIAGGLVIYQNLRRPSFTPEELEGLIQGCIAERKEYIILRDQQELLEVYRLKLWFEEVKPMIIATEFTVVSLKHMYAGTGDLLCFINKGAYNINGSKPLLLREGIYNVDYKTGGSADVPNWNRQIASYIRAIEENKEYKVEGGLIVHTNNNSIKGGIEGLKTHLLEKDEIETSFDEFLKIAAVYDITLDYQPKVIELPALLTREVKKEEVAA